MYVLHGLLPRYTFCSDPSRIIDVFGGISDYNEKFDFGPDLTIGNRPVTMGMVTKSASYKSNQGFFNRNAIARFATVCPLFRTHFRLVCIHSHGRASTLWACQDAEEARPCLPLRSR